MKIYLIFNIDRLKSYYKDVFIKKKINSKVVKDIKK